jgi:N utilization substance protein B
MANRHLSRSIVLQTLFEWDFSARSDGEVDDILLRNVSEFGPGLNDSVFMNELVDLVLKKKKIIDDIIEKAAPDWPIDKISVIDRNILRMGLVELLFGDRTQVPPKVAINEAIELAKSFGGENSGKFVNGVLGAVYKEIGEPGKDEESKKKKNALYEIADEDAPIKKKAGGVVFARHEGSIYFAMVHDIFGYWTLSKGGVVEGETDEQAALREVKKELGLEATIVELVGNSEYIAFDPTEGKLRKQVRFYLMESSYKQLELSSDSGGLNGAEWFEMSQLEDIKTYEDIMPLLVKSISIITGVKA